MTSNSIRQMYHKRWRKIIASWLRIKRNLNTVTFDDFYTLRYPLEERDDIIHPVLKALKRQGLEVNDEEFLEQYFKENGLYRTRLKDTLRESTLNNIVMKALVALGHESKATNEIIKEAVNYGLTTRKTGWFPDAKKTLVTLRKKGYRLALISNTHWPILENHRKEFEKYFDLVTFSYEYGYAKPHPSIFLYTLNELQTTAENSLHVGDDPITDIKGAKNVGMKTAFIMRPCARVHRMRMHGRREVEAKADVEIKQLIELTTL